MNLKFLVPENSGEDKNIVYINPVYWILKSFYGMYGKFNNQINWLEPIVGTPPSLEDTLQQICNENVDILCISVFVWNKDFLFNLSRLAKQKLPHLKIIAGGPELPTDDANFWNDHEFIDYAVYGDGEMAFLHILDSVLGQTEIDEGAVNIITRSKKYPHKVFYDEKFSQTSPYLENKNEIKTVVDKIGSQKIYFGWEMTRGCPYSCSFCDWNSGLHTKIKRRNIDWKSELDFFEELNIASVNVNDANWGIFKEDVEIHKYAMTKNFYFRSGNLPKLNKATAYDILEMNYNRQLQLKDMNRIQNVFFKISLQDTNLHVLKNISRPEIPWPEHKILIAELIEKNKDINLDAELIIGLPGQTVDSWIDTLTEISELSIKKFDSQFWVMLPKSPANKPDYQEKYSIKTMDLIVRNVVNTIHESTTLTDILDLISCGTGGFYKMKTVVGTYSCDFTDIITMQALSIILEISLNSIGGKKINVRKFLNSIKSQVYNDSKLLSEKMLKNKTLIIFDENNNMISSAKYYKKLLDTIINSKKQIKQTQI